MSKVAPGRRLLVGVILAVAVLLPACASRPENGFLRPVPDVAPGASSHALLVASTRERDERAGTLYNGERASSLDYASVTVSIPKTHLPGEIEWPSTPPGDPKTDFVVRQAAYLDNEKEFVQSLNSQLSLRPVGSRKVLLFVHGYNTLFAEALYRFAQVAHDSEASAVPILFTWASRAKPEQYIYDSNSATVARDELAHTIRLILSTNAEHVAILSHSMGGWVAVEALRQLQLLGRLPPPGSRLGPIILAAPDIDLDVFKSELRSFGEPRSRFYVVLSQDDRALAASRFVAGGESRLGDDANVNELALLGAVVIDLTNLEASDYFKHGKFAQLAEVAPQLGLIPAKGIRSNSNAIPENQKVIGSTLKAVVTMPLTVLGAPVTVTAGQN